MVYKNGSVTLLPGIDYRVSGNTVTILKSYLATLNTGTARLTFDFSAGLNSVLTVTIVDTTPEDPEESQCTISPTSGQFDKNPEVQGDIKVTITPNGNTLVAIKNGSVALVSGRDYTNCW